MDLREAVAVAKRHISNLFAAEAEAPQNVRLESFLYDDHLMVWTLTIGFPADASVGDLPPSPRARHKVVRVSEADKSVLSIRGP
jgi:hypothetical protein